MHPSREEFTELVCYISELKQQYSGKIDEQTIKINDQSEIIEELLWQTRELSDKLRQMTQKVEKLEKHLEETEKKVKDNSCICHYQNHLVPARFHQNRSIFSRQASMISRKSSARIAKAVDKTTITNGNVDDDQDNDDYEAIEFSDSASHLYAEPFKSYGAIRRSANIKTQPIPKPRLTKKTSKTAALKKTKAMSNLQILSPPAAADEEPLIENEVEQVELRQKTPTNDKALMPVGLRSGIYTKRSDAEFYETTRCFGYFNQFRKLHKTKANKARA